MLPLVLDAALYQAARVGEEWELVAVRQALEEGRPQLTVKTPRQSFAVNMPFSDYERKVLLAGGLLKFLGTVS